MATKISGFIANVAAERDRKKANLTLELAIPTWDKKLLWGFGMMGREWLEEKVETGSKRDLETDIDILVEATSAFWFFDPARVVAGERLGADPFTGRDRSEFVRIENDGGHAVKCDQELAEAVGFEPAAGDTLAPTTQLVLHLFKDNGIAIGTFVGRLVTWLQNTDLDVTKATLGE